MTQTVKEVSVCIVKDDVSLSIWLMLVHVGWQPSCPLSVWLARLLQGTVCCSSPRSKSWPAASPSAPVSRPWSRWPAWTLAPLCPAARPAAVRCPPEAPRYITASGFPLRRPCCSGSGNSVTSKPLHSLCIIEGWILTHVSSWLWNIVLSELKRFYVFNCIRC